MKQLRIILCGALLALGCTTATDTYAQQKSSEEQARMMTDRQKEQLALTAEQCSKVYPANLDFVQGLQQAKQDAAGDKLTMFREFRTLDAAHDKALKATLTPEQFSLFQKKKNENRKEMRAKFSGQ